MKNILLAIMATVALGTSTLQAQEIKSSKGTSTATIKVEGTCGMCKKRIENAAYIPGVKRAEWDKSSKELKVVFSNKKTTLNKIEQSVAKSGHDAGDTKAPKESYEKLPTCCAYGEVADH